MPSLYSNGPNKDSVVRPYQELIAETGSLFVASPFVTLTKDLASAASEGKTVSVLVGLKIGTNPAALRAVFAKLGYSLLLVSVPREDISL
jgi:hypothetical protein